MASGEKQRVALAAQALALVILAAAVGWPYLQQAFFSADDFRYLVYAERLAADFPGALPETSVIENRWDQSWWIEDGTVVRFFRPLVAPSYWLDRVVHPSVPRDFALTNLGLYAVLVLCVWRWLARLVASPAAAFLGAALFAALIGHAENLYFLAGRTEVLAAVPFVWALHAWQVREPGWPRAWRAGLALLFALLGKEWAVLLVPLLLAHDWLVTGRRALEPRAWPWRELALMAAALVLYGWMRALALGAAGAEGTEGAEGFWGSGALPYPYFHLPGRPGFAERGLAVLAQYVASLGAGTPVRPFLTGWDEFFGQTGRLEVLAGCAFAGALVFAAASSRRGAWLALVFAATLLALVPLYSTGRYLMLPSIAWAGMLAVVLERLLARPGAVARAVAAALSLLAGVPQLARRAEVLATLPDSRAGRPAPSEVIAAMAAEAGLGTGIGGARAVIVDFPGTWIDTQFLPELLQVRAGSLLAPIVDVVTELPRTRAPLATVERLSEHAMRLERSGRPLVIGNPARPGMEFDLRPLAVGERIREQRFEVEILAVDRQGRAASAAFRFDEPLSAIAFFRAVYSDEQGRWSLERFSP